jgi:hypothetical protein
MLPKTVKIGAAHWTVEVVAEELSARGVFGECDHAHNRLLIAAEQSEYEQEATLSHEIEHAISRHVGFDPEEKRKYSEEEWILRTSPMRHTVLVENGFWGKHTHGEHVNERSGLD